MNDIFYWLEGLDDLSYNKVKDYITNLEDTLIDKQECIDAYNEIINTRDKEITNLQQENERLKQDYINVRNYIKMRNVSTEVEDKALLYNIELENINKKKYLDYKSRCEKAVEYIEKHSNSFSVLDTISNSDLLNILQNGGDSQ